MDSDPKTPRNGSRSWKMIRIVMDPDPQHWLGGREEGLEARRGIGMQE
jgi:hypothetical protein